MKNQIPGSHFVAIIALPGVPGGAASPGSSAQENATPEYLVARWDFETGADPTADTAPAGEAEDELTVLGPVRFDARGTR